METFEDYLRSFTQLDEIAIKRIQAGALPLSLRRRQLLLREGEVCRHKVFVAKGLLRTFRVRPDGTESTMRFSAEKGWAIDPESYVDQIPSHYRIEALENTKVLLWTRDCMEELFENIPSFRLISERLREKSLNYSQQRIFVNLSHTAEEKYEDFIQNHPDIFRRIPLHMVASYLGVSRETLSRIRHKHHAGH